VPFIFRLRKWLLRPSVRQLGLFISVGGALGSISWMMKPSPAADMAFLWKIRIASLACFVAPIVILLWVRRLPDLVPDFLAQISPKYFERDGLCFLLSVELVESRARMVVHYQNRFDRPCDVRILIAPTPKAFLDLDGLPRFEFDVSVQGGEFGKQSLAWSVPSRFQGHSVLWDVAAKVRYPSARGNLLRGGNGMDVGERIVSQSGVALKAIGSLVHLHSAEKLARVESPMPKGGASDFRQPADLQQETIWKLNKMTA
jgi:hypothetical protein